MKSLILPGIDKKIKILAYNQSTHDIAKGLQMAELQSRKYGKYLRNCFAGTYQNKEDLFKRIHGLFRQNISYRKESSDIQTVRPINRIMYDGFGDCKHFSICIGSTLQALNIPWYFRLTSYNKSDLSPTHVYIVTKGYPIDGVLENCGEEKKFFKAYDIYPLK